MTILIGTATAAPRIPATTASPSVMLTTNAYLLFASVAPLRFSTLVPLLLINSMAFASTIPLVCVSVMAQRKQASFQLCAMRTSAAGLVMNCAARMIISFAGAVAAPACMLAYMTESCTLRAFRHCRALEAAHVGA